MSNYIQFDNSQRLEAGVRYMFSLGYRCSGVTGPNTVEEMDRRFREWRDWFYLRVEDSPPGVFNLHPYVNSGFTKIHLEGVPLLPKTLTVCLNSDYKAILSSDGKVKVGCQTFEFKTIEKFVADGKKFLSA